MRPESPGQSADLFTMEQEAIYSNILVDCNQSVMPRCGNNIYIIKNTLSRSGKCPDWREEVVDDNEQDDTKVFCTYCIHQAVPAVKFCILCEAFLCHTHLKVHSKSGEHILMAPRETFRKGQNLKCPIHNELLRYYCFEDATCICISCSLAGLHKHHQIEPLPEASERRKRDFKNILEKLMTQQRETDVKVQKLQSQRTTLKDKGSNLSARVSDLFTDARCQLDDLELRVLNEIAKEEKRIAEPISHCIQQLEQQKDELSRNIREIEGLCNSSDPLTILRKTSENKADFWFPRTRQSSLCDPEDLDEGLILVTLQRSLEDIMARIKRWHWASDVTLDVNTAANDIYVSGDKRTISWSKVNQRRQKSIERFKSYQVMSTQGFSSGRHYWEIDISPTGKWIVGVCYPSMDRKGEQSFIGNNDKSWGLGYQDKKYRVVHGRTERHIPSMLPCNKIGIYLDYEAGQLSFYEVSDIIRHIHTFTTIFTEPIHAIFWVWYSWVRVNS